MPRDRARASIGVLRDSGLAIIDAFRLGLLPDLAGLAELIEWHTASDTNDPKVGGATGRQSRLLRSPGNLFDHIVQRVLSRIDNTLLRVESPEREIAACDMLAALIEVQSNTQEQGDVRSALIAAIEHLGANAKPKDVITWAHVANKTGRDALRILQKEGRYHGFSRPRPDRYEKVSKTKP